VAENWKPAKVRQRDRDTRGTVKYTKAKVKNDDADPKTPKPLDLAIPTFGYKNHVGIDQPHGLIHFWNASGANAYDVTRLPGLVSQLNEASGVLADATYRSRMNKA